MYLIVKKPESAHESDDAFYILPNGEWQATRGMDKSGHEITSFYNYDDVIETKDDFVGAFYVNAHKFKDGDTLVSMFGVYRVYVDNDQSGSKDILRIGLLDFFIFSEENHHEAMCSL